MLKLAYTTISSSEHANVSGQLCKFFQKVKRHKKAQADSDWGCSGVRSGVHLSKLIFTLTWQFPLFSIFLVCLRHSIKHTHAHTHICSHTTNTFHYGIPEKWLVWANTATLSSGPDDPWWVNKSKCHLWHCCVPLPMTRRVPSIPALPLRLAWPPLQTNRLSTPSPQVRHLGLMWGLILAKCPTLHFFPTHEVLGHLTCTSESIPVKRKSTEYQIQIYNEFGSTMLSLNNLSPTSIVTGAFVQSTISKLSFQSLHHLI